MFLRVSQISQENTCVGVSFYYRCRPEDLQLCKNKTPTQVFPCEIGKKNLRISPVAASEFCSGGFIRIDNITDSEYFLFAQSILGTFGR